MSSDSWPPPLPLSPLTHPLLSPFHLLFPLPLSPALFTSRQAPKLGRYHRQAKYHPCEPMTWTNTDTTEEGKPDILPREHLATSVLTKHKCSKTEN